MAADAEQPLLELAVGGETARVDDAVDPPVDHDRDLVGNRSGDADVLFDDEDRHVAFLTEPDQHFLDPGDDHRREALGRLVHDEKTRIRQQRAGNRQHLLLAARKLTAAVGFALGQAREGLIDALDVPRTGAAVRDNAQMFVDAQRSPETAPCGT